MSDSSLYLSIFILGLFLFYIIVSPYIIKKNYFAIFFSLIYALIVAYPVSFQDSVNIDYLPTLDLLSRSMTNEASNYILNSWNFSLALAHPISALLSIEDPRILLYLVTFIAQFAFILSIRLYLYNNSSGHSISPLFLSSLIYGWGGFYLYSANIIRFNHSLLYVVAGILLMACRSYLYLFIGLILLSFGAFLHPALLPLAFTIFLLLFIQYLSFIPVFKSITSSLLYIRPLFTILLILLFLTFLLIPRFFQGILLSSLTFITTFAVHFTSYFQDIFVIPFFGALTLFVFIFFFLLSLLILSSKAITRHITSVISYQVSESRDSIILMPHRILSARIFLATFAVPILTIATLGFGPFYRYLYFMYIFCFDIYSEALLYLFGKLPSKLLIFIISISTLLLASARYRTIFEFKFAPI